MAQNRDAPAFQEYAAAMMAKVEYRTMTLAGRGLLYSLRLECWVNRSVPADSGKLARMLGYDRKEVEDALLEVSPFLKSSGGVMTCPELDAYRVHLEGIKTKQIEGGKLGAIKTNSKRKASSGNPAPPPTSDLRVTDGSLVKLSSVQLSQNQPPRDDEYLAAFDRVGNDYSRASNGE